MFSSNQETSRQLRQALIELDLQVEHCPEIFSAVEKLTSHSFDVIAVDWDEGAEASFLLKTARELKSNQNAVTVAVINDDASFPAAVFGVNVVLRKPVLSDEIKYSLLTCDEFLAGMRAWLARGETAAAGRATLLPEKSPAPRSAGSDRISPEAVAVESPSPGSPASCELPELGSYGGADLGLFSQSGIQSLFHSPGTVQAARKPRDVSRFLLIASGCVAFLAASYAFSQPAARNPVALALVKTYDRASRWIHRPPAGDADDGDAGDEEAADYNPAETPRNRRITRIRITDARHGVSAETNSAGLQAASYGAPGGAPAEASQTQPFPIPNRPRVPESLKSPALEHGAENAVAEMVVPSRLAGMLQPVNLTQDLAEKLLLERVVPSYPVQAIQARLQGPVVLQAWIGRDGAIRELKLVRGSLLLGKAACDAVKRWRYRPYLQNGRAVEAQTFVTIDFRLPAEMEAVER
jgi:TonB family protein